MRNFKKILLPIMAVLILMVVNIGMNYALIPYSYVRIMMHQVETQNYDTVFLGTSHGLNGISPNVIERETGAKTMNLCLGGEYPRDAYYMLKKVCEKSVPKTVIYELDAGYWCTEEGQRGDFNRIYYEMPFSKVKVEYFISKMLKLDFRATLFPWFYYRGQIGNIKNIINCKQSEDYKNYGVEAFRNEAQSYEEGFMRNHPVEIEKPEEPLELWNEKTKNKDSFLYFEKMASFCEKQGITLIVITTPVPEETLEKYNKEFQKADTFFTSYLEKFDVQYWNYNRSERKIENFDYSLKAFSDYEGHMNWEQAEIFSAQIAKDFL
ncbi:MAG: hypothetical protein K1V96_00765 [Lachnospiraceae bacterium]